MEARLLSIGLVMGAFAWSLRQAIKRGAADNKTAAVIWHGAFCAFAGFILATFAVMFLENPAALDVDPGKMYSGKELRAGIFGALALGAWGAGNAWTRGAAGEARKKFWAEDLEWADMLFSAALMASVWMYFIVQAFVIPSGSMRNTLFEGDRLFVNKFIYGVRLPFAQSHLVRFRAIRRGDIVVFRFPTENKKSVHCGTLEYGKDLIKRVVGEPGDVVAVRDGELYRNGAKAGPEPYAINDPIARFRNPPPQISPEEYQRLWESQGLDRAMGGMRDQFGPVRVPEGTYLVMGDNRDNSCDSRFWGPVPVRYIKGKAWVKYWPPSRIGLVN